MKNPEVSNCAFGPSNPVKESNGSIETPLTGEELRLKEGGWFQVRKIPWVIGRYLGIPWGVILIFVLLLYIDVFAVSFGGAFLQDNRRVRCVWRI